MGIGVVGSQASPPVPERYTPTPLGHPAAATYTYVPSEANSCTCDLPSPSLPVTHGAPPPEDTKTPSQPPATMPPFVRVRSSTRARVIPAAEEVQVSPLSELRNSPEWPPMKRATPSCANEFTAPDPSKKKPAPFSTHEAPSSSDL